MTWPAIVMHAVVLLVGVPAMWRNPTAVALVCAWAFPQALWYLTGDNLPLDAYFMADIAVIAVIYGKTIRHCGPKVYRSGWHQLRCLATDLTVWDRWIVAIYMIGAWPLYIANISDRAQWFALWGLAIAQFLLAAGEAVSDRRRRSVNAPDLPDFPAMKMAALPVAHAPVAEPNPSTGSGSPRLARVWSSG